MPQEREETLADLLDSFEENERRRKELLARIQDKVEEMLERSILMPANRVFYWDSEMRRFSCKHCRKAHQTSFYAIEHHADCAIGQEFMLYNKAQRPPVKDV